MKKIVNICFLVIICLLPIVGSAKAQYEFDYRINNKFFIFENDDVYYYLNNSNFDLETANFYLYDNDGNFIGKELVFDSEKITKEQFIKSERLRKIVEIDTYRYETIFDEETQRYYSVRYYGDEFYTFDPFIDNSGEYLNFEDNLDLVDRLLGKKYDLFKYFDNNNYYVETIFQYEDYFIVYYYTHDENYNYKYYCSIMDIDFNDILVFEDTSIDEYYITIYDNLIYRKKDDKTIEIYNLEGLKIDSININQDFLEDDLDYDCDSYDLKFFLIDKNDIHLYYVIESCPERIIMRDDNDFIDNSLITDVPSFISLKYSLNYEIEKVESSSGDFTYEEVTGDDGNVYVELDIKPATGYTVKEIIVTDVNGNKIEVTDNKFIKPMNDVKVEVKYVYGEYLPIPDTFLGKSVSLILIGLILISLGIYTVNYIRQE